MATHSSLLAWRIPWTEEPGGLQSIGSQSRTRLKQLSTHAQSAKYCSQYWEHIGDGNRSRILTSQNLFSSRKRQANKMIYRVYAENDRCYDKRAGGGGGR